MSTVHAQVEKMVHRCTICDRKFAQKYRLTNHEKSHINYFCREFVCNKCPDEKRFATLNRYRTHEKQVHEGEKTYGSKLCSDCGIIFHSASSLIAHRYNLATNGTFDHAIMNYVLLQEATAYRCREDTVFSRGRLPNAS
jgi:hypothetical protein